VARKKLTHRRQAEERPRRRKSRSRGKEIFSHEIRRVVYRFKNGRLAKKGVKGAKKYVTRILYVIGPDGKPRKYGELRERNKKPLARFSTEDEAGVREGIFIKGLLEDRGIIEQLEEDGARGVEIYVRGRSVGKEHRLKTRFILDENKMHDPEYLKSIIAGRVQAFLKSHGFRLSHHSIGRAKNTRQLKKVRFSVFTFY
jgi:hypothetical protein